MVTEIHINVSFLKRTLTKKDVSVGVIQGDYNTTKMVFNIEEDVSQYSVRLEMSNPLGELIFAKNLTNNEVILGGEDEKGNACSIFNTAGLYPFELVLYDKTSKLTSATGWLNVFEQKVNLESGKSVDYYLPLFEEALEKLNAVDNLDISATKEGKVATISVTNLQGEKQTVTVRDGIDGTDYVLTEADKTEIINIAKSGAEEAQKKAEEAQQATKNSASEAKQAEENAKKYAERAEEAAEMLPNVTQTTGTSETDVMSQNSVSKEIESLSQMSVSGCKKIYTTWENKRISNLGNIFDSTDTILSDYIKLMPYGKLIAYGSVGTYQTTNLIVYIAEYDESLNFLTREVNASYPLIATPKNSNCAYVRVSVNSTAIPQDDLINCVDIEYDFRDFTPNVGYAFDGFSFKSINHRGYNSIAPENTLPAFRLSKQKGFDFVECDVVFTADNVPVLLHDTSINRTGRNADGTQISGTVNIADITYEQALTYDFGVWKGSQYAGIKIPTFEEFIVLCKKLNLYPYIEIKFDLTQEQANIIVNIVKKYRMEKHVTYIAFGQGLWLKNILNIDSGARVGVLSSNVINDYGLGQIERFLKKSNNHVFIDSLSTALTTETIDKYMSKGFSVEVYCPNTEEEIIALDSRISGVTSDLLVAKDVIYEANIGADDTGL